MEKKIQINLENRDSLELSYNDKGIVSSIRASGCLELLTKVKTLKSLLPSPVEKLFVFADQNHTTLMINEGLLKAANRWNYPYKDEELCHCRAIPLKKVDAAIVSGFHDVEEIAEQTSAGTACGNCRRDTQNCITYRLANPSKVQQE